MLRLYATQFAIFSLIGILNTAVDFGVYYVLTRNLNFLEFALAAKAISFCFGVLFSFFMNRYWTFSKRESVVSGELIRFFGTVGSGIFINMGVYYFTIAVLGLHDLFGVLLAAAATALWGFLFSKFYVFK
jgi:putative flippase GtrA